MMGTNKLVIYFDYAIVIYYSEKLHPKEAFNFDHIFLGAFFPMVNLLFRISIKF